jgi:hypothetical protein
LGNGAINWNNKKQTSIVMFNKSWIYGSFTSNKVAMWLSSLFESIGGSHMKPIVIYDDNQSYICL